MGRKKIKWRLPFLIYLVCISMFTKSLPLVENIPVLNTADDSFQLDEKVFITTSTPQPTIEATEAENIVHTTTETSPDIPQDSVHVVNKTLTAPEHIAIEETDPTDINETRNSTLLTRNEPVRPGQVAPLYTIEITANGDSFNGRAIIRVELDAASREDLIVFHAIGLNVQSVMYGIYTLMNPQPADYWLEDDVVVIEPPAAASTYIFLIEYTGAIRNDGHGLYRGVYGDK